MNGSIPASQSGDFQRAPSRFRDWVRADGSTRFKPESGRYHLYISLACPWAHRTLIVRNLRKLEDVVSLSVVSPVWNEEGWWFGDFPGTIPDSVNGKKNLIDIYRLADPSYQGDETTPVLWDKSTGSLVSNESRDIIRMLDHEFAAFGDRSVDLCPKDLQGQVDQTIETLYAPVNNGVYRAGFARSQAAYERAVKSLFDALDHWEKELSTRRYLCGDRLTEADICFFTTLVRFDLVYYIHFKCSIRRITDYKNLWAYLRDIYQHPGVAGTTDFDHIKNHYYRCHTDINPSGIVPVGPELDFTAPHDRNR